jgi:hypothetical protein
MKLTTSKLNVPDKHQLRIALDTLRMPDAMVSVMGEMTKRDARAIVLKLTGKAAR